MDRWSADFVNNPMDDYNLIVEILFNGKDVALISKGEEGLEVKWYPSSEKLVVPLDWFLGLLQEAKQRLMD